MNTTTTTIKVVERATSIVYVLQWVDIGEACVKSGGLIFPELNRMHAKWRIRRSLLQIETPPLPAVIMSSQDHQICHSLPFA
jgi:hypothetical protein